LILTATVSVFEMKLLLQSSLMDLRRYNHLIHRLVGNALIDAYYKKVQTYVFCTDTAKELS
jgi:hypothetical protein